MNMRPEDMEKAKPTWGWSSQKDPDEPEWPVDEKGEAEKPAHLTTVMGTGADFEMTVSMLHSFGVPTLRSYPQSGRLMRVLFGFTGGGMDIFVPESRLAFAKELLEGENIEFEEEAEDDGQE